MSRLLAYLKIAYRRKGVTVFRFLTALILTRIRVMIMTWYVASTLIRMLTD